MCQLKTKDVYSSHASFSLLEMKACIQHTKNICITAVQNSLLMLLWLISLEALKIKSSCGSDTSTPKYFKVFKKKREATSLSNILQT